MKVSDLLPITFEHDGTDMGALRAMTVWLTDHKLNSRYTAVSAVWAITPATFPGPIARKLTATEYKSCPYIAVRSGEHAATASWTVTINPDYIEATA